jgi:polyhydroxybutyrate depolymerase
MKKIIFLLTITALMACNEQDENPNDNQNIELEYYDSMVFDGLERTYFVHLPQNYNSSVSYPLIFVMHGGGALGYQGIEFIDALLEKLKLEIPINEKKVYATGFSNGGQLAYKLANRYPNKFAAVSAVAGVLQDFPFDPSRKVPIIHFHSYQDSTAPYNGGFSDAPFINFEFPSVDSTLLLIANNYNCGLIKQTIYSNPSTYDFFKYSNCDNNVQIELYVSQDGGHTWPGGQAFANMPITNHFNASDLMWEFFQNYENYYCQ